MGIPPPADPGAHGRGLQLSLAVATRAAKDEVGGYDPRLLLKLQIGRLPPDRLEHAFPGVEVVSQEGDGFVLAFANATALSLFEQRLSSLATGQKPKYPEVLYALRAFELWTPENRQGWALRQEGMPATDPFVLDAELWPLAHTTARVDMVKAFRHWLAENEIHAIDDACGEGLVLFRLRVTTPQAWLLLHHRDVRGVDLPPRVVFEPQILRTDLQSLPRVQAPPAGAPIIAVLDSGIASNHPLLGPAIADAQGFLPPELRADDENGHGTMVAGIALYGDVEGCLRAGEFRPQIRILSGRVLDEGNQAEPRLLERIVDEAVRQYHRDYGCRIFNLSYGDPGRPYLGGRLGGLAFTLDRLARELDVLFVVPTGNLPSIGPRELREGYPELLLESSASLIDPAPALNALTVGSLVRRDGGSKAALRVHQVAEVLVARPDQPSPFTRTGGSLRDAIKPDVVAYGGSRTLDATSRRESDQGLGEVSTSNTFADGHPFREASGTSYAAPQVAHLAANLLAQIPRASANLLRALLIANARIPAAAFDLVQGDSTKLARLVGYGLVDPEALYRSTDEQVLLYAEDTVLNDTNHFYEIPFPPAINGGAPARRLRQLTVALAHAPAVRTTRLDYRATRLKFRYLQEASLAAAVVRAGKPEKGQVADKAPTESSTGREHYGATERERGTVQASTWAIKARKGKKLFVVVTRNDQSWAEGLSQTEEPYALVIRLADRENPEPRLYAEVRAILQAREQARQRIRV